MTQQSVVPKLQFLDLSHHNWPIDWDKLKRGNPDLIAVGWKASEGNYMTDDNYDEARIEATRRGFLWMAYHFATDDLLGEQVQLFLDTAKPDASTRLALDWEDYGANQIRLGQAAGFLAEVDARVGRIISVYGGNTIKEALGDYNSRFFGLHPLWICRYPSNVSDQPEPQESWKGWDIWQYAADGDGLDPNTAAGCDGYPDCNVFADDEATVRANWPGRPLAPAPPGPAAEVVTVTIAAPASVTVNVVQTGVTD